MTAEQSGRGRKASFNATAGSQVPAAEIYRMTYNLFIEYCKKNGATRKVYGDIAYRSPRYREKTNTGRYIKLKREYPDGSVLVHDNKKGYVTVKKGGK